MTSPLPSFWIFSTDGRQESRSLLNFIEGVSSFVRCGGKVNGGISLAKNNKKKALTI